MPIESVANGLFQARRGKMVAHVGIAGACGDAAGAYSRGEYGRFADTETSACIEHGAGAEHARI